MKCSNCGGLIKKNAGIQDEDSIFCTGRCHLDAIRKRMKPKYYIYPNKKPREGETYLIYIDLTGYPGTRIRDSLNKHQESAGIMCKHGWRDGNWFWRYP